jgi:uncharacterized protein YneF (UPF0154 family)
LHATQKQRKDHCVSVPPIDEAQLEAILLRAGLKPTGALVKELMPGAVIVQRMIARVNAPLPREAEPALTFDVEQG